MNSGLGSSSDFRSSFFMTGFLLCFSANAIAASIGISATAPIAIAVLYAGFWIFIAAYAVAAFINISLRTTFFFTFLLRSWVIGVRVVRFRIFTIIITIIYITIAVTEARVIFITIAGVVIITFAGYIGVFTKLVITFAGVVVYSKERIAKISKIYGFSVKCFGYQVSRYAICDVRM